MDGNNILMGSIFFGFTNMLFGCNEANTTLSKSNPIIPQCRSLCFRLKVNKVSSPGAKAT
jgi:hypothetical protein